MTSQVQLILSRDLAREVIKDLNLTEVPEFNAALKEFSPLSVLRTIGILKDPMSMTLEERVLAAYYDRLTAFALDKSRVISIEFQSADPELAARGANLIAEKYLSLQQVAKQDQARSAGQWLSGELEKLRSKVSEAEAKVEDYRAKSNLFVGSNNTSLVNQQLTELSSQVSAARAQKADAEARARLIRDALRSGQSLDSSDVANSELIRRLVRAARDVARATRRAILDAVAAASAHQGDAGADRRSRPADSRRRRAAGALARKRGQGRGRAARNLEREPRSVQAADRIDQRSGRAVARARARGQGAARPVRILSRQVSRGDRARQHRGGARRRPHHLARGGVEHPVFPEEDADRADRGARHVLSVDGLRRDRRAAQRRKPIGRRGERASRPECPAAQPRVRPTPGAAPADRLPAAPTLPDAGIAIAAGCRRHPLAPPSGPTIDDIVAALHQSGEGGRRIAVIGSARNVGTTLTRDRAGAHARAHRPRGAGRSGVRLAERRRDLERSGRARHGRTGARQASFGDIITRDRGSRAHLVTAGQVGNDATGLLQSQMLWAAVGALAQSYDYLVIDAGAQSEIALAPVAATAPYAVLVGGETPANALAALAGQLQVGRLRRGRGPDRPAAGARTGRRSIRGMTTRGELGGL